LRLYGVIKQATVIYRVRFPYLVSIFEVLGLATVLIVGSVITILGAQSSPVNVGFILLGTLLSAYFLLIMCALWISATGDEAAIDAGEQCSIVEAFD
jgi:hypothetical protein